MVYNDVIKSGLILARKTRYDIRDYRKLRRQGHDIKTARWICICSAAYHETSFAKSLYSTERLQWIENDSRLMSAGR